MSEVHDCAAIKFELICRALRICRYESRLVIVVLGLFGCMPSEATECTSVEAHGDFQE